MAVCILAAVATCVKLLFIPAYRSTDFEVHRNWLAITHSLPIKKWYLEETSEWTLDYPPLFAWFEYIMSLFAGHFDPAMLEVSNLNYASSQTVLFQRMSVIVTDFVYYFAVKEFHLLTRGQKMEGLGGIVVSILLIFNVGLFIVDHILLSWIVVVLRRLGPLVDFTLFDVYSTHATMIYTYIHFQYNGILFGIMLLSVTRMLQERFVESAFWFAVLLNMKHIFIYVAPAWFIHLLRNFCFQGNKPVSLTSFSLHNFLTLASVVALVFGASFGPFIYIGQLPQVLSRLFPFKRGLVHAYWAPNFWALYSGVDKILATAAVSAGLVNQSSVPMASMTGGMVQEYNHVMLPSVAPLSTMILVLVAMVPALFFLWEQKTAAAFTRTIVLCAFTSFLFGWHVHEKAVLMIIIPMTLMIMRDKQYARLYLIMATVGFYSLFPLLFSPFENVLKVLLLLQSSIFAFLCMEVIYSYTLGDMKITSLDHFRLPLLNLPESFYILGLIPLGVFNSAGVWLLGISSRLPFLPLLLTSLYCSVGVIYCWVEFYVLSYSRTSATGSGDIRHKRKKL
ncbi:unnamed protein product [Candidula unifasciata]|uniref:Alpha-1,3-glucosyltransferase n=1 Tax=Candidula unifasciata TaxID=100452 RepID=A0A8S3YVD3_9EUPU|nr:unnamed protein product [Candidula unifasciata]